MCRMSECSHYSICENTNQSVIQKKKKKQKQNTKESPAALVEYSKTNCALIYHLKLQCYNSTASRTLAHDTHTHMHTQASIKRCVGHAAVKSTAECGVLPLREEREIHWSLSPDIKGSIDAKSQQGWCWLKLRQRGITHRTGIWLLWHPPVYISPPLRGPDFPHVQSLCARRTLKSPPCTIKHGVLRFANIEHSERSTLLSPPLSLRWGQRGRRNLNWMNQVSDNEQYDNGRTTPPTLCSLFKFRVVPGIGNLWGWLKKIRE